MLAALTTALRSALLLVALAGCAASAGGQQQSALRDGMVATVWLRPSGLPAGTPFHDKAATFWGNQSQFEHYMSVRDRDAALLKASLGGHPNATVILYFEAYLADAAVWGEAPVQRLGSAVTHFAAHGVSTVVFFGDPEFSDLGGWDSTHDVVRNATANAYLRKNVACALAAPGVAGKVRHASVYWLGGGQRCKGDAKQAPCSESQVAAYNTGLASTISAAGAEFLMHVDGPFWNGKKNGDISSTFNNLKMIILPRQAQDKHSEPKRNTPFAQGAGPRLAPTGTSLATRRPRSPRQE
jgi:hypothetical protein